MTDALPVHVDTRIVDCGDADGPSFCIRFHMADGRMLGIWYPLAYLVQHADEIEAAPTRAPVDAVLN